MSKATYDWTQLSNGPRLAVATVPDSECAAVTIHIPAGSRDEENLPTGLAHFVEHMVFKGTTQRTARELSCEIENAGGQINACTSEDQTTYDGRGEAELLPLLIDILSDMVWNPTFPESELELEREVIGEEITMYRESPSDHISDLISQAIWSNHPLGNPISGSIESIAKVNRQHLLDFQSQHHFRNDIVIAAAGPFTLDEVKKIVTPLLPANFHDGNESIRFDQTNTKPGHVEDRRKTDQLQLALAWHTPGRHSPKRHALRLLSLMLGETASSRLFLELREERGLCYQISSECSFYDETGAFEIYAGLDPDSRSEAMECINRQIDDIVKHGPRDNELERSKRLAIAQSKFGFETTASHASWAGEGVLDFNYIPSPADWRKEVLAVTAADIQTVATETFLNQQPSIAEITPKDS